jgi:hypothetical protein
MFRIWFQFKQVITLITLCLFHLTSSYPTDPNSEPSIVTYPTANSSLEHFTTSDSRDAATDSSCASTDPNYKDYGLCWDELTDQLQISSHLSIKNLVRFFKANMFNSFKDRPNYYKEICNQVQRFNSERFFCVSRFASKFKCRGSSSEVTCYNDKCVCVMGKHKPPGFTPGKFSMDWPNIFEGNNGNMFSSDYWTNWADKLTQTIQKNVDDAFGDIEN